MRRQIVGAMALLAATALADEYTTSVFPVYQQPAAELLPVLRPLIGPGSTLAAHGDRLILRGTAADTETVVRLLEQIDRPARRLVVEVRQTTRGAADTLAGVRRYGTAERDDLVQRVQTLDGRPALIRSGEARPEYRLSEREFGGAVLERADRLIASGFYVLPRTNGDEVTLEIYRHSDRLRGDDSLRTGEIAATLRGRLGEWLDLGGVDDAREMGINGTVRHWSTQGKEARQTQVRVRALD